MSEDKKSTLRERFCWYCGDSLGVVAASNYHYMDTCGKPACGREARQTLCDDDQEQALRRNYHDRGFW